MQNTPPERVLVGYLIHRAERLLERETQAQLSSLGITFSTFHFLRLLMRQDGRTHKEIAYEASLTPSTTANAMKSLMKGGFITRHRGTTDSREVYIHLTPKALALKPMLDSISSNANQRATALLSAEQVQTLQLALRDVISALESPRTPNATLSEDCSRPEQ